MSKLPFAKAVISEREKGLPGSMRRISLLKYRIFNFPVYAVVPAFVFPEFTKRVTSFLDWERAFAKFNA